MHSALRNLSTTTLLNLVQTAAIVIGFLFGFRELGELRKSRELDATLKLVDVIESHSVGMGMGQLMALPANLSEEELEQRLSSDSYLMSLATTCETLGLLVHRREVSFDVVDELFGGTVVAAWARLSPYILHVRERNRSPELFEWFQWLAERLKAHRAVADTVPAYELYHGWTP